MTSDGGILTVKNLTMIDGNAASGEGGAIRLVNGGRTTVSDSRFINNRADAGGAILIGWTGTGSSWATVNRSSFLGNRSRNTGGAIYAGGGTVTVSNSSFVRNSAGYNAVVSVVNPFTRLNIDNSSFINNSVSAMRVENGATATLTHLTIKDYTSYPLRMRIGLIHIGRPRVPAQQHRNRQFP